MKVKKFLAAIMQEELAPIRERRKMFEKDIPAVYDMLKKDVKLLVKLLLRQWMKSAVL